MIPFLRASVLNNVLVMGDYQDHDYDCCSLVYQLNSIATGPYGRLYD